MKLSQLIKDQPKAQWVDFNEEVSFKVNPLDDDRYQVAFEKYRRHVASQDHKTLNLDVSEQEKSEGQVQCELFAKYIITDWKGVVNEEDEAIPYNADMAYQMLKTNTEVFLFVFKSANELTVKNEKVKEDFKKKSEESLNTNSSTETKAQKSQKPSTKS